MKESLYDRIGELLKTKEEYRSEDGDLLKAKVYSDIMTMDKNLISILLSDEEVKKVFFLKVDDTLVFDKQKFAWIIDSKEFLPDSYTTYTNKIGLTNDGEFISQRKDVVLDFPYKDCVLEGGQDKDDQKRKEIFYNETIAQDEIRRMLDPKVFTNAKRYTKDGVEEGITFNEDDNLIIKGNNLIALESLLERYEGQVKCIYIDPPYNTGSDSFNYNDSFNHSTWLTFMKNRLELAKKLLTENGLIFVECDYKEQAYLKVLMDNIFNRQNFINMISIKSSTPSGVKVSHANKTILKSQDFILAYKIKDNVSLKPQYQLKEKWDTHYMYFIDEDKNKLINLVDKLKHEKVIGINDTINNFDIKNEKHKEFYLKNAKNIVRKSTHSNQKIKEIANSSQYINNLYFHEENGYYYLNNDMLQPIYNSIKTVLDGINLKKDISNVLCDFWDDIDFQNTQNQGGVSFPAGKKPEQLLYRLIDMSTVKGDLVLDFHLGSGTTAAVAHKMGRRYIGVEQMDYIEDITVERLKKVIDGEQGGISKAIDWQGGGSFVYCELLENGNELIREIENADENTIKDIKEKIYKDERIIPYITREELEKADKDFEELTLEEKKKALIKLVDKNKLYINYSDKDSADYTISDADKKFTKSFYEVD